MQKLEGIELTLAKNYLTEAQKQAQKSTCRRRKCGAIIVRSNEIIGKGYNSPPQDLESQRRCDIDKDSLDKKITDKTCCVHAERRAISRALKKARAVTGGTMYFTSVDNNGNRLPSDEIYCTDCSKNSLDEGISEWVLERKDGVYKYGAEEYDNLSFAFKREQTAS